MTILGPDGGVAGLSKDKKKPIVDVRMVLFPKMVVHPETKQMVMVPMQDMQYRREDSTEWFSVEVVEVNKHEFNPEDKNAKDLSNASIDFS